VGIGINESLLSVEIIKLLLIGPGALPSVVIAIGQELLVAELLEGAETELSNEVRLELAESGGMAEDLILI
jgi:hypothetical protein